MDLATLRNTLGQTLELERVHNARIFASLRLVAVSGFLIYFLFIVFRSWAGWHESLSIFVPLWVFSVGAWWMARKSARWAVAMSLTVPLIDLPVLCLLQIYTVSSRIGHPGEIPSGFFGLFLSLVALTVLTLQTWQVLLTAAVAVVLNAASAFVLEDRSKSPLFTTLVTLMFACFCVYARHRVLHLVAAIARLNRLRRYFPPEIAEMLQSKDDQALLETREITVMFVDIRGFGDMAATLSSKQVVEILSEYYTEVVNALFKMKGTLDKFMGDGIMAYFGAPFEQADHARQAVACAFDVLQGMQAFNERRAREGQESIKIGIGIHTGVATLGVIGSPTRMEYTAVGNTVNLAWRIEEQTKVCGTEILLSDATFRALGSAIKHRSCGTFDLRGFPRPVELIEPLERPITNESSEGEKGDILNRPIRK